jgi:HD superfamily phosphodiesterase
VLVAACYLHDIGYALALARGGFHPLDGARFLRALGRERLACLVQRLGSSLIM